MSSPNWEVWGPSAFQFYSDSARREVFYVNGTKRYSAQLGDSDVWFVPARAVADVGARLLVATTIDEPPNPVYLYEKSTGDLTTHGYTAFSGGDGGNPQYAIGDGARFGYITGAFDVVSDGITSVSAHNLVGYDNASGEYFALGGGVGSGSSKRMWVHPSSGDVYLWNVFASPGIVDLGGFGADGCIGRWSPADGSWHKLGGSGVSDNFTLFGPFVSGVCLHSNGEDVVIVGNFQTAGGVAVEGAAIYRVGSDSFEPCFTPFPGETDGLLGYAGAWIVRHGTTYVLTGIRFEGDHSDSSGNYTRCVWQTPDESTPWTCIGEHLGSGGPPVVASVRGPALKTDGSGFETTVIPTLVVSFGGGIHQMRKPPGMGDFGPVDSGYYAPPDFKTPTPPGDWTYFGGPSFKFGTFDPGGTPKLRHRQRDDDYRPARLVNNAPTSRQASNRRGPNNNYA